jgi:hypothetical protein
MTKHTIEIFRDENFIKGYGWLNAPYTEEEVLDAVAKLCNEQNKKVYKHLIRHEDENISDTDFYSPEKNQSMRIPRCHKVVYCDVWLQ